MDAAGLLFDAAAKKLELRKMTLMSVGDMESLSDIVKHQLILMTKAGDAILKYLDKTVNRGESSTERKLSHEWTSIV